MSSGKCYPEWFETINGYRQKYTSKGNNSLESFWIEQANFNSYFTFLEKEKKCYFWVSS